MYWMTEQISDVKESHTNNWHYKPSNLFWRLDFLSIVKSYLCHIKHLNNHSLKYTNKYGHILRNSDYKMGIGRTFVLHHA